MLTRRAFGLSVACTVGVGTWPLSAAETGSFSEVLDRDAPPGERIDALLDLLITELRTDRAFIYMRNPATGQVGYTHLVTRISGWDRLPVGRWSKEPPIEQISEPLLRSAYLSDAAHFIPDIETAPPGSINVTLERSYFGHRALIHAPLHSRGDFFGILETAMRDRPRNWSPDTRTLIAWLQPRVAELCRAYLTS